MKTKRKTVIWRHQYNLDNIFNIVMYLFIIPLLFTDDYILIIFPALVGLFVNTQARGYFNKNKYI